MKQPNLSAEVVLPFGDGEHLFALKWKQIEHLEKLCDASVSDIASRVIGMRPRLADIRNVILLGLEGGGMPPVQAKQMVERYLEGRPIAAIGDEESPLAIAIKVASAMWFGVEDVTEKDPKSGEAQAGESPAGKSTSEDIEPS